MLNHARWSPLAVAGKLLAIILDDFLPSGPVVIGLDETIERRRGHKISARGIYRDPARSSHGHFPGSGPGIKTSGLRWLSVMAMVPVPWTRRRWGLPFLTILAPSERHDVAHGRRHEKLTDWARQAVLQVRRWLPKRKIVVVADSGFASLFFHRRAAPPRHFRHPVAPRRQPLRTGAAATARKERTTAQDGTPAAQALRRACQQENALDQTGHALLVWRRNTLRPLVRHGYGALESLRPVAGSAPLGSRA